MYPYQRGSPPCLSCSRIGATTKGCPYKVVQEPRTRRRTYLCDDARLGLDWCAAERVRPRVRAAEGGCREGAGALPPAGGRGLGCATGGDRALDGGARFARGRLPWRRPRRRLYRAAVPRPRTAKCAPRSVPHHRARRRRGAPAPERAETARLPPLAQPSAHFAAAPRRHTGQPNLCARRATPAVSRQACGRQHRADGLQHGQQLAERRAAGRTRDCVY
jgi:hypothetical protein